MGTRMRKVENEKSRSNEIIQCLEINANNEITLKNITNGLISRADLIEINTKYARKLGNKTCLKQ